MQCKICGEPKFGGLPCANCAKKPRRGGAARLARDPHKVEVVGSNPTPASKSKRTGSSAVERRTEVAGVGGSIPSRSTKSKPKKKARSQVVKAPAFDAGIAGSTPAAPAKPLTDAERQQRRRKKDRKAYNKYMRDYRARLKIEKPDL